VCFSNVLLYEQTDYLSDTGLTEIQKIREVPPSVEYDVEFKLQKHALCERIEYKLLVQYAPYTPTSNNSFCLYMPAAGRKMEFSFTLLSTR
jgi:hypothetical protein